MTRGLAALAVFTALSLTATGRAPRPVSPLDPHVLSIDGAAPPSGPSVPLRGFGLSPDGGWVYATSSDGLRVMKIASSSGRVERSMGLLSPSETALLSPDGARLAVLSEAGGTVAVLNSEDLSTAGSFVTAAGPRSAAFSADGVTLYVSCAAGRALQAFDLATATLGKATTLPRIPAEMALLDDARLAIAAPEAGAVLVYELSSLELLGEIPVPPGTAGLALRTGAGKNVMVATSALADLITLIDATTLDVLKTIVMTDPAAPAALADLGLVLKEATKIVALEVDPFEASFGEARTTAFLTGGLAASRAAASDIVALSADRSRLTRVPVAAVEDRSRTDSIVPARGIPGTWVHATGRFATGTSAVFLREEVFGAPAAAEGLTDTSFDAEIPLETPLGTSQLWVTRSSAEAAHARSFVASSPIDVQAIGSLEAVDDLIRDLESRASDSTLGAAAVEELRAAIDALRRARQLLVDGWIRDGLVALADAFDAMERAGASGAALGTAPRETAHIVQYTVYAKLDPVRRQLGEKDEDVQEALARFADARALLRQGKLREAIYAYVSSYDALEVALAKARRLRPAQAVTILRKTADDLGRLRNLAHTRLITGHGHHSTSTPLHAALARLGRTGELKGAAIGHLATFRVADTVAQMKAAVAAFAAEGHDTEDLEALACGSAHRLVSDIADAVEANVGPFDPVVARARRYLGECAAQEAAGDHAGMMESLHAALGEPLSGVATPELHLFQATATDTTECHPSIKIRPINPVCLDPVGGIDPNPMRFQIELGADVAGAFGYLFCSIKRSKGGQVIRTFETRSVVAPSVETYDWDGKDDNGQIVKMKGKGCQDTLIVEAEFVCYSSLGEPHSAADDRSFTLVGHDGILIDPSFADLCASDSEHEATYQFRAYKCTEGGGREDVTETCLWTLDNPQIGEIKAGLFKAKNGARGKGKITATLPDSPCPGQATVTVTPDSGGIVEPSVDLCVNGKYDFDVVKGCNADNTAIPANDRDYIWTVSDPAKGTVTGDGIFRALAKGFVTVSASNPETGEFHTATVNISDIDEIDIVRAPVLWMCSETDERDFEVQVFCNAEPKDGVSVTFTSSGEVSCVPVMVQTAGGGSATTSVAPTGPGSVDIGTGFVRASAQGVSNESPLTVVRLIGLTGNYDAFCFGEAGTWTATTRPAAAAALTAPHLTWRLKNAAGTILDTQAGVEVYTHQFFFDGGFDDFGVLGKNVRLELTCDDAVFSDVFDAFDIPAGWPQASRDVACVNDPLTFRAETNPPGYEGHLEWRTNADALPSSGAGGSFNTRFTIAGEKRITVSCHQRFRSVNVLIGGVEFNIIGTDVSKKLDPGRGILVNDDDDNRDATPDRDQASVQGENDLVGLVVHQTFGLNENVVVTRTAGTGAVTLWRDGAKSQPLSLPLLLTPADFQGEFFTMWAEGVVPGPVELTAAQADNAMCADRVKLRVIGVNMMGSRLDRDGLAQSPGGPYDRLLSNIHPVQAHRLFQLFQLEGTPEGEALRKELEANAFKLRVLDPSNPAAQDEVRMGTERHPPDFLTVPLTLIREGGALTTAKPFLVFHGVSIDFEVFQALSSRYHLLSDHHLLDLIGELQGGYKDVVSETNLFVVTAHLETKEEVESDLPRLRKRELTILTAAARGGASVPVEIPAYVVTDTGLDLQMVTPEAVTPRDSLLGRCFRLRVHGHFEGAGTDKVTLALRVGRERPEAEFTRIDDSTLESQPILFVDPRLDRGDRDFLKTLEILAVEAEAQDAVTVDAAKYKEFKGRRVNDVFDLYLYGHANASVKDRLEALLLSYDGAYAREGATLGAEVVDRTNVSPRNQIPNHWPFIPVQDTAIPGAKQTSELDLVEAFHKEAEIVKWKRDTAGWTAVNGFPKLSLERYGPWDPHTKPVVALNSTNFTNAAIKGKRVSLHAHGSTDSIEGTYAAYDKLEADYTLALKADADLLFVGGKLTPSPKLRAQDFFNGDGTPFTPKELLLGSCNGWLALVDPLKTKNIAELAAKQPKNVWTSPIAAVNGLAKWACRVPIHFAAGATDAERLRVASEYSSLLKGMVIRLDFAGGPLDINNLPAAFKPAQWGVLNDRNTPDSATDSFVKVAGRQYKATWKDLYLGTDNTATFEFTGEIESFPDADPTKGTDTLIKVRILEDKAHAIYAPLTFWMVSTAKPVGEQLFLLPWIIHLEKTANSAAFVGAPSIVGPGMRSFQDFARSWAIVTEAHVNAKKVTHAYWDTYMLNGYTTMGAIKPPPPNAPLPRGVFLKEEFAK